MKIKIIKFDGTEIIKNISSFELRRNQVSGWIKLDNGKCEQINKIATIQILNND